MTIRFCTKYFSNCCMDCCEIWNRHLALSFILISANINVLWFFFVCVCVVGFFCKGYAACVDMYMFSGGNMLANLESVSFWEQMINYSTFLLILEWQKCLSSCPCYFTCGNTFARWNRKVIEPLALHVTGACAEDIWCCGIRVFQPCHQPLVLTATLERVASQISDASQREWSTTKD